MNITTRLPWMATSLCLGLLLAGCGPQQQKNTAQNTDSTHITATNTAGSTGDTPATAGTLAETAAAAQQMPGSDRDEHGCIGSPVTNGRKCSKSASGFSKRAPGWYRQPIRTPRWPPTWFSERFAPVGTLPARQSGILPVEPPENFRRSPMERRQRRHAHGGTDRRKMER